MSFKLSDLGNIDLSTCFLLLFIIMFTNSMKLKKLLCIFDHLMAIRDDHRSLAVAEYLNRFKINSIKKSMASSLIANLSYHTLYAKSKNFKLLIYFTIVMKLFNHEKNKPQQMILETSIVKINMQ